MSRQQNHVILTAVIKDCCGCLNSHASNAATKILDLGFTMSAGSSLDAEQNERLKAIEAKVNQIFGWTGLPRT